MTLAAKRQEVGNWIRTEIRNPQSVKHEAFESLGRNVQFYPRRKMERVIRTNIIRKLLCKQYFIIKRQDFPRDLRANVYHCLQL